MLFLSSHQISCLIFNFCFKGWIFSPVFCILTAWCLSLLQDDYRVCMDFNIIQKDSVPVCPVDASGCFTAEVADFAGQYVKVSGPGDSK